MKLWNVALWTICLGLAGCAEMGLKPHEPKIKSTIAIAKSAGTYKIIAIKGDTSGMDKILNNDLISCGTTTFSMPRGNTVKTYIREIFEQELLIAEKLSNSGTGIIAVVKGMDLATVKNDSGEWTMDIDYLVDDKTYNVKNTIEFESKVSIVTGCTHTASIFKDALADNLVEFFKRYRY